MFNDKISRRQFLRTAGKTALGGSLLVAVGGTITKPKFGFAGTKEKGGGEVKKAEGGDLWRQYAGTKLIFMSENTPPSSAVKAYSQVPVGKVDSM